MHSPRYSRIYTPSELAAAMIRAMDPTETQDWLEPCCGNGELCRAIIKAGISPERITAIDLDRRASSKVAVGQVVRGRDFITWASRTSASFDRIVANPPFASIRSLSAALKSTALTVVDADGAPISGQANCWYAFLLRAMELLRSRGSIAFVLPAAWEYASYARALRETITNHFERIEVHRSRTPLFSTVLDGSVVLIAHNKDAGPGRLFRSTYSTPSKLIAGLSERGSSRHVPGPRPTARGVQTLPLDEVFSVKIGGVTGDARYFLMTECERVERQLPLSAVVPVLSRSSHLCAAEIRRSEWENLRDGGERIWLFRPRLGSGAKGSVRKYLLLPPDKGGCERSAYKVCRRSPWYQTPLPERADGFVSGMSMSVPWIAWKQMRGLSVSNTLYVVRCRSESIRARRYAWALGLLTTSVQQQLNRCVRVYAGGLRKFELRDLAAIYLPIPPSSIAEQVTYRLAVRLVLNGKENRARELADSWFASRIRHRQHARQVAISPDAVA